MVANVSHKKLSTAQPARIKAILDVSKPEWLGVIAEQGGSVWIQMDIEEAIQLEKIRCVQPFAPFNKYLLTLYRACVYTNGVRFHGLLSTQTSRIEVIGEWFCEPGTQFFHWIARVRYGRVYSPRQEKISVSEFQKR